MPSHPAVKPLLRALQGHRIEPVPIWLLRQAGRYLPEYRALRARAGDFLDCCNTPELAAEITLQPVRRFGLDAAIVFSDILVLPHALGRDVRFGEGEGPVLEPLDEAGLDRLSAARAVDGNRALLATLAGVKRELDGGTALIGFAGAPLTVAAYMVDGRGGTFPRTRALALEQPALLDRLVALLGEAAAALLIAQIDAGAEAVQLFDSWAGLLNGEAAERWSVAPVADIAARVHEARPGVPVIGFPRGSGEGYRAHARRSGVDALQLDQDLAPALMRALQAELPVQGNLDPQVLFAGGARLERETRRLLETLKHGPHIANLGHGVDKRTPPEHVAEMVRIVRAWRS